MKKSILYAALAMATVATTTSCGDDFLVIDPVGAVSESTLTNVDGVDYLMTAMYATLYNPSRDAFATPFANYPYGDVFAGDANKGSEAGDQSSFTEIETYSFNASNQYLRTKWRYVYDGIRNANQVLSMAEKVKEDLSALQGEEKDMYTETVAQATFIRALYHFEAAKIFGAAVPYVGLEDFEANVDPAVSNVDESGNYIYIWDKIANDFKAAYDNLPDHWSSEKGRVNKWAAAAFLAKTYIYWSSPYTGGENGANAGKWSEAKSLIETILANGCDANGNRYQLAENYSSLWQASESDWTGESIFDIQTAISGTQTYTNSLTGTSHIAMAGKLGGGWGFFQPSYYYVNSFLVDDNGLPLNDYASQPDLSHLGEANVVTTDLDRYVDPRLDFTVGRFQVPFYDWGTPETLDGWVRSAGNGGIYMNKKYLPTKEDKSNGLSISNSTGSTAKNTHVMRVADLYLLYAECCIQAGDLETARTYINKVRARAANSYVKADDTTPGTYSLDDKVNGLVKNGAAGNYRIGLYNTAFASAAEATTALRNERKAELGLEGQHWFDMARWGTAATEVNKFIAFEKSRLIKYDGKTYSEGWICFPIPQDEIVTQMGALVQNAAWK